MTPSPIFDNPEYKGSEKLKNKVAIITGGDSGLGRAASIIFVKEGAKVVIPYFNEHKDILEKFTRALEKGIIYVKDHNEEEIAKVIAPQFPDSSVNNLKTIVKRYKDYDSWLPNGFISEEIYKNLEDIMIDAKLIEDYVPYDKLVRNISHE